jgi:hypothetical protein
MELAENHFGLDHSETEREKNRSMYLLLMTFCAMRYHSPHKKANKVK